MMALVIWINSGFLSVKLVNISLLLFQICFTTSVPFSLLKYICFKSLNSFRKCFGLRKTCKVGWLALLWECYKVCAWHWWRCQLWRALQRGFSDWRVHQICQVGITFTKTITLACFDVLLFTNNQTLWWSYCQHEQTFCRGDRIL